MRRRERSELTLSPKLGNAPEASAADEAAYAREPLGQAFDHVGQDVLSPSNLIDDAIRPRWEREAFRLQDQCKSAVDRKAIDFGIYYYAYSDHRRTIKGAAASYGIKRDTASSYMQRLASLKMVQICDPPTLARDSTLPRVYLRRVFWSEDWWNEASDNYNVCPF